ncbi:MAG: hypothetical protein IT423_12980 [Pirellulaceae bacterium]|nr:hypothetical protein [Pirellulaceae bacterium]
MSKIRPFGTDFVDSQAGHARDSFVAHAGNQFATNSETLAQTRWFFFADDPAHFSQDLARYSQTTSPNVSTEA